MKIIYAFAATLAFISAPALAQDEQAAPAAAVAVPKGAMIFTAEGRRVGRVDRVQQGFASVIYNGKFIRIPVSTLTPAARGFTTSITKAELGKL